MPRVLVYEPIDPTGESLEWLASHGVDLVKGPPMWQSPYHPFDERELIRQADGCIGLMGWLGARNMWQMLNGEVPESLVNPEALEHLAAR